MKHFKKVIIVALILTLYYPKATFAQTNQTFNIEGRVVDNSNSVVSYANCALISEADSSFVTGTTCGNDGRFILHATPSGNFLLIVRHIGHTQTTLPISLSDNINLGDITLKRNAGTLKAVTVTAEKPIYSDDGEKTYYHVTDDPAVQTGSVADALQNAPGVEVDAKGVITFRGSTNITVLINDKPTHLDDESLRQYIKNMPATSVERIEVIENPSARYDASGTVVNIITKHRFSMNQLLCVGLNGSTEPRISPWASYVWANERVSVNLYVNSAFRKNLVQEENSKSLFTDDTTLSSSEYFFYRGKQKYNYHYIGANVDYSINDLNLLSAQLNLAINNMRETLNYPVTHREFVYDTGDYSYQNSIDHSFNNRSSSLNIDFLHMFGATGQTLKIGVSTRWFNNLDESNSLRDYVSTLQDMGMLHTETRHGPVAAFNLDYTNRAWRFGEIEAGMSASVNKTFRESTWDSICPEAGTLIHDGIRSFSSEKNDNEISQYFTLRHRFGKLSLKGGIRLHENWKMLDYYDLKEATDIYDVDKFFFNIVPSLHTNYKLNNKNSLNLSYSYRFGRPGAETMSNFQVLDLERFSYGNPNLEVNHSHSINLNWSCLFQKGSVSLSAYHWKLDGYIAAITDVAFHPYFGRIVEYSTYNGEGEASNTGLQFTLMLRPAQSTTVKLTAVLYDNYYNIPFRPGTWTTNESLNYNIRLNAQCKLWKVVNLFANVMYTGKKHEVLSYTEPIFMMDAGLSANLLNERLSLYLDINDLFNSLVAKNVSTNVFLYNNNEARFDSRQITVGATWRFGKTELSKKAQQGSKDK